MADMQLLTDEDVERLAGNVDGWTVADRSIRRTFQFENFRQSMDFVNGVARLAEKHDHHPDIFISYSKVILTLTTHKLGGLSRPDFDLAGAIDRLPGAGAPRA